MTDKAGIDSVVFIESRLEGKQTEKFVGAARDFFGSSSTPCVNRGAYVVCCGNALAFKARFEQKVKDIEVDAHKGIDARFSQCRRELSVQAIKLWQAQYWFSKAVNR